MRITRPLLDSRSSALLILLVGFSTVVATSASCSSSDVDDTADGGERSTDAGGGQDVDVVTDAAAEARAEAGPLVDAAPLPIECPSPPCAVALTTAPLGNNRGEEGYCAVLEGGTVACWGTNKLGQLGNGDASGVDSHVPVRVSGLSNITAIHHTCAVGDDGAVWCWSKGPFLQNETSDVTTHTTPVRLPLAGPAKKVAITPLVGCAILSDEGVVCWGSNESLQIDQTGTNPGNMAPSTIALPAGVKELALGAATFAIYADGKILSWGSNPGIGRTSPLTPDGWPSPVPLGPVTMVDSVDQEACAVANGVGWCWGPPDPSGPPFNWGDPYARALPIAVDTPEPVTRIATTSSFMGRENNRPYYEKHRWCATSVSGAVYCWGLNNSGQAGDGSKQVALRAVRVAGLPAPAAEVKVLPYSTCALLTNGKVYCWGSNSSGQLGAGLPKGSALIPSEVKLP